MSTELQPSTAVVPASSGTSDLFSSALFSSARKRTVVLCLLLACVTLAIYNPVVHNGFINIDDNLYLLDNTHVHQGLTWSTIKWSFLSLEQANWHPLTWISHALDWQLFGKYAGGHHYMGLLFHTINVILLFLLLQSATGFTWRSLMVAALFALHPVNVESVAWAAERKNLLSMMFFLLAMLEYGRHVRTPSVGRYATVFLLFACALMAKPQVVTFPFVLLLWDYWPLQRMRPATEGGSHPSFTSLLLEKVPFLVLAAADSIITMYAQHQGSAVRTLSEFSLRARLENSIVSYARYIAHAFWPLHLSPSYSHPGEAIAMSHVAASLLLLLAITLAALLCGKRYVVVGWLWFVGILIPMIGIIQVGNQAMADRYAYIPYIGLFWIAVWAIADAAQRWQITTSKLAVPAALILAALAFLTVKQIPYWHDSDTLWSRAIQLDYGDWVARSNYCGILVTENRVDEAIAQYNIVKKMHNYPTAEILRFADYELRHGHPQDAVVEVRGILATTNDPALRAYAFVDLGVADLASGNDAQAETEFENATREQPDSSGALLGLGLVAARSGDFATAASEYAHAVQSEPSALGYFLLSLALNKSGQADQAREAFQKAEQMSPDMSATIQRASTLIGVQYTPTTAGSN